MAEACQYLHCTLQIGVIEDTENRDKLAKLLRFYSSKAEEQLTSLDAYVSRMKEGQKSIYYMAADNVQVSAQQKVYMWCLSLGCLCLKLTVRLSQDFSVETAHNIS